MAMFNSYEAMFTYIITGGYVSDLKEKPGTETSHHPSSIIRLLLIKVQQEFGGVTWRNSCSDKPKHHM